MTSLPDDATEAARRSLKQRVWRNGRYTPAGIAELGAWLALPRAVAVEAGISRVAAALARAGDTQGLEARRVSALAVLADPLRHLAVLAADAQPALDADVEVATVRRLATISGCEGDCGFDDADRESFTDGADAGPAVRLARWPTGAPGRQRSRARSNAGRVIRSQNRALAAPGRAG